MGAIEAVMTPNRSGPECGPFDNQVVRRKPAISGNRRFFEVVSPKGPKPVRFTDIGWMAAVWAFCLAGCMAAPDYPAPDLGTRMADHWSAGANAGTGLDRRQQPATEWWRQFNDDTLTALVERLSGSSLALAESRERIAEAFARRGVVGAGACPQAAATAAYTRAESGNAVISFQGPPAGMAADLVTTGAAANWELDLWGRTQRLGEAADADIEAGYADYRSILVSLCAEMSLAYIDLRTLEARLDSVFQNIALHEKSLELAHTRLSSGIGTSMEVAQIKRLLQTTRAQVPELRRAASAAGNRIDLLLGARPGETVVPAGELPEVPELIGIGIPLDLMTRRPDIQGALQRYQAAVARTRAAEADKYPRLSLSGTLSLQSDSVAGMLDPDALIYSLGPGIHFPLFTGGRIDSSIQQRASQAEQARLVLGQKLLQALSEVETAAAGVVRTQERVQDLQAAEKAARESVTLAEALFRSGLADFFQVLDSEKQQVALQDSLLLAQQQALAQVVTLYRALGGGWEKLSE